MHAQTHRHTHTHTHSPCVRTHTLASVRPTRRIDWLTTDDRRTGESETARRLTCRWSDFFCCCRCFNNTHTMRTLQHWPVGGLISSVAVGVFVKSDLAVTTLQHWPVGGLISSVAVHWPVGGLISSVAVGVFVKSDLAVRTLQHWPVGGLISSVAVGVFVKSDLAVGSCCCWVCVMFDDHRSLF